MRDNPFKRTEDGEGCFYIALAFVFVVAFIGVLFGVGITVLISWIL